MSANYWTSSHRQEWQFTREQLAHARNEVAQLELRYLGLTNEGNNGHNNGSGNNKHNNNNGNLIRYDLNMRIYLHQLIVKLGRKLNFRQIVISTAEVYMVRFLIRCSLREINIYLLATTCIYVACKIEESPQHIRTILSEARNCWPEFIPNDLTRLAEFEFYLIEEMDCYLVIHHPYNSLIDIIQVMKEGVKEELVYYHQVHNNSNRMVPMEQ
ncbi:unnamed protein product [Ambrosiozyma monospora]|uniref:Unnamed protein product n=1 Tax=Ambrosiozyma monospora TaxID=43982 RepID=A0ACB5UC47_AMBMO|nr:unnamed protein product [Ambrosiozyma monospora]